jgi:nucleotide-binding universal stress UspA family protein
MASVVVGVDPSSAGQAALRFALREALVRGTELVAVRTWTPPAFTMTYPVASVVTALEDDQAAEARTVVEDQLKLAVEDVPGADAVERRVVVAHGPAAQVLVDEGRDATLLVVGSRGLGALSRAVLGSVSSSVLHHAIGPVAVVPAGAAVDRPVGRVLVGVDHSASSREALRWGADEASLHDSALVPVHVREAVDARDVSGLEQSERASLRAAATAAGATDRVAEPEVLVGHPAATLRSLARPDDLLVVGSRGRGGFAGLLLGSTSTQLAQHASAPVVVVRRP